MDTSKEDQKNDPIVYKGYELNNDEVMIVEPVTQIARINRVNLVFNLT